MLQVIMCGILLYPLITSLTLCKKVWSGDFTSLIAGQLTKYLPKIVIKILITLLPIAVLILMTIIVIAKPL